MLCFNICRGQGTDVISISWTSEEFPVIKLAQDISIKLRKEKGKSGLRPKQKIRKCGRSDQPDLGNYL
jgi:hypothetical protein